ncbi:MAG: CmcI family methyltransferase [Aquihabitans sp.]
MFPFWNVAIAPVLEAGSVRRLVEIGALRGENTKQIIDRLGPETELHVIDPVPDFDPSEHERRFAGQYIFHQDLSINVLGGLPPMDAALVDGDHNWFTVYHELRLLRQVARDADAPLPILILHDVGWPYGRRDLYYDPETVPAEFRQPWDTKGIRIGESDLVKGTGGLNPTMCNATHEGGPRNGVMTALDDWLAEHDRPVRVVVLPVYFGLAIVVEEERLARQPALAAELDRLESIRGKDQLLRLTEDMRLRAMVFQHTVYYPGQERERRLTSKYLRTVKAALLNEHYLENESRLAHLTSRMRDGRKAEARILRDPVRHDQDTWRRLLRERTGAAGANEQSPPSFIPYTAMGRTRLDHLERCLDAVRNAKVAGDLVECGTGHGGGAIFMRAWLDAHELPTTRVWVADRFRAAPEPDKSPTMPAQGVSGFQPDLNLVRDGFERFDLLDERVKFLQGTLAAALADAALERISVLRIGRGLDAEARDVLDQLYDRVSVGGWVIVEDHPDAPAHAEVAAFRAARGITGPLDRVDESTIAWRKTGGEGVVPALDVAPAVGLPRVPLAPPAPTDAIDLTVVVVFYNMRREAERTLRSLSRSYQEGIADVSYEIVVIDNGSAPEERLDRAFVESFGPEFRLLEPEGRPDPSPVMALNQGIRAGRGRNFALMIDGAHVVTPGIVRFGLAGLTTYEPAIVATQQWYVGPGQQGDAMDDGYDQVYEDRLFESIDWPRTGYRLFEISHFIGDRDWLDGLWESNCIFVGRATLEQVGCFDESFSVAGGGYANLELYERLGSAPDITVATILGEGSFHQLHGGDTTNQPDAAHRRAKVFGYSQQYADMRGRAFRGPGKPIHYVGSIGSPAARRTRARRLSAEAFAAGAQAGDVDGPPSSPIPMADELGVAFTEAVYRTMPWTKTSWLGRPIETPPTDLLAYQEIIASVRPDYVVETGTGDGGRTLFLASICELVGHGRVISVDPEERADRPQHPRITYVTGRAHLDETADKVRGEVGNGRALVVLGSVTDRYKTSEEFDRYSALVPVGSYVVVTDTVVNGHPVWAGFGPGPTEAVKQILARNGGFVADPDMVKYALSFNPGGYLRRVT